MIEEIVQIQETPKVANKEITPPSAPVLKSINCIYVPASDPYETIQWFNRHFGLKRTGSKPMKRDTNGESIALGNGTELFVLKAADGSRMTFQTDVWSGPDFQLSMLSFEVDDIVEVHRSLQDNGAKVEELRDANGCGMAFYFYDPDGNKFCAWELQTMVMRQPDGTTRFANCYFRGNMDDFLKEAAAGSRQYSRRVQIVGHRVWQELDPEGLKQLEQALGRFSRQHPERAFRIVYRE